MQHIESLTNTISRLQLQLKTLDIRIAKAQQDYDDAEKAKQRHPHSKVNELKLQTAQVTVEMLCHQKHSIEEEVIRLQRANNPEHLYHQQEVFTILRALEIQRRSRRRQLQEVLTKQAELRDISLADRYSQTFQQQERYTLLEEYLRQELRQIEDQILIFSPASLQ